MTRKRAIEELRRPLAFGDELQAAAVRLLTGEDAEEPERCQKCGGVEVCRACEGSGRCETCRGLGATPCRRCRR